MTRVLDPRVRLPNLPKDQILFAFAQSQGEKPRQEDVISHFVDECFVVCDGVSALRHADVAAKLASETAIWAYKTVRQRQVYWLDKTLLVKRIFRSTNLCIWQKHREEGFRDGLATTMVVAIMGPRAVWVGGVGDSSAFVFRQGQLLRLTILDRDYNGELTRALGYQRLGLRPNSMHQRFVAGDLLLLATDGIADVISPQELTQILRKIGDRQQDMDKAAKAILAHAKSMGSKENMTVCLIKRIALPR